MIAYIMAKRRSRKKSTPRRKKTFNATNFLEGYLTANVVTQTMFRANPVQFLTGYSNGKFRIGSDSSNTLTIPEMIKGTSSTIGGGFREAGIDTPMEIVRYNLERNNSTQKLVTGLIMIPIAFRVGKKVLSKPRSQVNSLIKNFTGAGVRV